MPDERCNCENMTCTVCKGDGCNNPAGPRRAMYVGRLCNDCAKAMPKHFMLDDE